MRRAVLALAAVLAGCAAPPATPPPKSAAVAPHLPPARQAPAKVATHTPQSGQQKPPVTQEPLAPPADAAPPEPTESPPAAEPPLATLVGLSQSDVRALLGDPATAGAAGPAQTWTYRAADCSVTVAFFYDVTRGAFFALSSRAEKLPEPACLTRLHGGAHAS